MNVTLSRTPAVSLMLTYSLTVSLGTSVGKAVRPWLLQSTVLLLHTHFSGQAEAKEPKEPTITRLPRSPVSRLMLATPTLKSVGFTCFQSQDTCVTVSHCKPVAAMPLGGFFLRVFRRGQHRPSLLVRLQLPAIAEPDRRTDGSRVAPARDPTHPSLLRFSPARLVRQVEDTFEHAQWGKVKEMQPV